MYFTIMHHADELDVRIIKEMGGSNQSQWNVRESYSNIAERLGIDEETVRSLSICYDSIVENTK